MPQRVGSPANHGERELAQTRCLTGRTPLHPRCLRQGRLPREHVAMRPPPCGLNHATCFAMGGSRRHATRRHAARRHATRHHVAPVFLLFGAGFAPVSRFTRQSRRERTGAGTVPYRKDPMHSRCLRQGSLPREHVAMRPPPCGLNHATRLAMGGSRRRATRRHAGRRHAALCRVVGIAVAHCPLQLASAPQRPTRRVSSPSRLFPRHRACVPMPRLCRPERLCRVGCANSLRRDPRMKSRSR